MDSIVSISKAALMVRKSRKTIQNHIKQGKLSKTIAPDGTVGVDISELIRVYGNVKVDDETEKLQQSSAAKPNIELELQELRIKVAVLEKEKELQQKLMDEKDKRLLLLENQTPKKRKKLFGIF